MVHRGRNARTVKDKEDIKDKEDSSTSPFPQLETRCCMDKARGWEQPGTPALWREVVKWGKIAPSQLLQLSKENECRSIIGQPQASRRDGAVGTEWATKVFS